MAEHDKASLSDLTLSGPGLTLVTGPNGSGKSTAARALGARVAGSSLLSAESQQAFYEAQLAADESNFRQGVDTSSTVRKLLGESGLRHPLFAAFRLEALWERGYRRLSTGEARKVLLLQAVLRAPSLLILDDPFDRDDCRRGTHPHWRKSHGHGLRVLDDRNGHLFLQSHATVAAGRAVDLDDAFMLFV